MEEDEHPSYTGLASLALTTETDRALTVSPTNSSPPLTLVLSICWIPHSLTQQSPPVLYKVLAGSVRQLEASPGVVTALASGQPATTSPQMATFASFLLNYLSTFVSPTAGAVLWTPLQLLQSHRCIRCSNTTTNADTAPPQLMRTPLLRTLNCVTQICISWS